MSPEAERLRCQEDGSLSIASHRGTAIFADFYRALGHVIFELPGVSHHFLIYSLAFPKLSPRLL